jgi:glycosyltransferase involved in cell wall biosynthesis
MTAEDSICVLFPLREGPWGGGNQFLKAVKAELERRGLHEPDPARAGAVLTASWQGLFAASIVALRQPSKPIVLRVDGPVGLVRGRDREIDRVIYRFDRLVATGTIFQSDWSREANIASGMTPGNDHMTIVNAPDPQLFSRAAKRPFDPSRKARIIATSWSPNPRKGFDLYGWLDSNLDFGRYEMSFIGNSPVQFDNIRSVPPINSAELARQIKQHDIYITGSRKDPCSNSLLEALHCGLPAVAVLDGGHPELIKGGGETFEDFSEVPAILERIVDSYEEYQERIAVKTLSAVVDDYVGFMWAARDNQGGRSRRRAIDSITTGAMARAIDYRIGRALLEWGFEHAARAR